jgi:hypothetical protein
MNVLLFGVVAAMTMLIAHDHACRTDQDMRRNEKTDKKKRRENDYALQIYKTEPMADYSDARVKRDSSGNRIDTSV